MSTYDEAYASGHRDGAGKVNDVCATMARVQTWFAPTQPKAHEALIDALPATQLAEALGLPIEQVLTRADVFAEACASYDEGYRGGAVAKAYALHKEWEFQVG